MHTLAGGVLHAIGAPVHTPALQVSFTVQGLPSLHEAPLRRRCR